MDNREFLEVLFGDQAARVHVTGFSYDPSDIPKDQHLSAWAGGRADSKPLDPQWNQYFTISLFHDDEEGKARRRKALFDATHVIVLDDVKEKLSLEAARQLPPPTYVLETSPGSEQWGYKLDKPCADRARVENLLDGLVHSGLAPDGKDPGMRGVTRYVRLPEGHNTKQSKMLFGVPWKCQMKLWEPERTVTMEDLAMPFGVNLDAPRREQKVDGASDVPDHPLLGSDCIQVKEIRSEGRFDVVCPWVHEHTGAADDGAGIFTNGDGSIGFKCHHGACESRTGKDLLDYIEEQEPGFRARFKQWQALRVLPAPEATEAAPAPAGEAPPPPPAEPQDQAAAIQPALDEVRRLHPDSQASREMSEKVLRLAEDAPVMERYSVHDQVRDILGWSQKRLDTALKSLREEWYKSNGANQGLYQEVVFVRDMNLFYNWNSGSYYTPDGFTNAFCDEDEEVRKNALQKGMVRKVDRLDYAPGMPIIFVENGIVYANMYTNEDAPQGIPGDCTWWLEHWDHMGWSHARDHMLQWFAYTIKHPETKINHMMILGSPEGAGKDFLLRPIIKAMGGHGRVIGGESLTEGYSEYLQGTKYLHINEVELGNHNEALQVANKLKPIAAAPPDRVPVKVKYANDVYVRNVVNGTLCTNSKMPLRVGDSRRFYALWSDLRVRDSTGQPSPEWKRYWSSRWQWMEQGGEDACIWYLRNCVDLSNFNPGEPPPVTTFMQAIQERSKSPAVKTLEAFRAKGVGCFKSPMAGEMEIAETVTSAAGFDSYLLHMDKRYFNLDNIGQALESMGAIRRTVADYQGNVNLWIFEDLSYYKSLSGAELLRQYHARRNERIQPDRVDDKVTVVDFT